MKQTKATPAPLDMALSYIARGWFPIPVPFREKGKNGMIPGWPELRITADTAPQYFNGKPQNIGVLLGDVSNGLTDIDLDHELARRLAPHFLPETDSMFGRQSNPNSHCLYIVTDGAGELKQFKDAQGMLIEYRAGDGVQSVFPGSTHKETGELIEWSRAGEPVKIERKALLARVGQIAAATLIAKRWKKGARDPLCTAVVGAMLRSGAPENHVEHFIVSICKAVDDDSDVDKCLEKIRRFARHIRDKDLHQVPGWPSLEEVTDRETVNLFREWLGIDAAEPWPVPHDFLHERTAKSFTASDVPASIGDYATRWAAAAGFDPTGVIASCVVTTAAALHDSIRLSVQPATNWMESARLWVAVIGAPGLAKTPMIRAGNTPLVELHREKVNANSEAAELERESQSNKKRKGEEAERVPLPALFTNDCTIEKLSEVLADNDGGVLYIAEELDSWLGSHDAYRSGGGSRDRGEWLTLFDGGPHQVDRVKRGSFFVSNWGVSLVSATTPAALQKLVHKLPNDGLLQRILPFMIAHPSAPDPTLAVLEATKVYEKLVRRVNEYAANGLTVTLDADARALFESENIRYRELAPACAVISEGLAGHMAKYGTVLARLVLTFHAVQCAVNEGRTHPASVPVPLHTVELAARFLRKVFGHARAFYGMMSGTDDILDVARRVGTALVADGMSKVARSELVQKYKIFRDADDDKRREAMQLLVDFGWCRVLPGKYQMGYATNWEINPTVHERFRADGEAWARRRALVKEAIMGHAGEAP
jgi:Protein of unknown function (DUF3987)/Bifunctional DNA primase/polymerase, N-terminal